MIHSFGVTTHRQKLRQRLLLAAAILVSTLGLALASCSGEGALGYPSLGDSLAAGVGSSPPSETSYSALYREALEERTGREVEYRQFGLSGETVGSFMEGYPEEGSQLTRAEDFLQRHPGARVTLSLGGNDLIQILRTLDSAGQKREAISEYGENLGFILRTLRSASEPPPEIIVLTLYDPEPGGPTERWTGEMNEEIRSTVRSSDARTAGAAEVFRGHTGEYLRYYESGERDIHPNDQGYAALSRAIVRADYPLQGSPETVRDS